MIGYSFGSLICLELASVLEKTGKKGQIILIDGAPMFLNKLVSIFDDEEELQNYLLSTIIALSFPEESEITTNNVLENLTWDVKVDELVKFTTKQNIYSSSFVRNISKALLNRMKLLIDLDIDAFKQLQSTPLSLIRSTEAAVIEIDEDYGLQKFCKQKINLQFVDGNHMTVLDNVKLIEIINTIINHN